jgi:FMN phosphatase YigB (HAD superfamily)
VPSCELKTELPNAQIFETLKQRASVDPSEVIYVSSDQVYLDAAASSGIIGVHFKSTDRLAEVLAKLIADASV